MGAAAMVQGGKIASMTSQAIEQGSHHHILAAIGRANQSSPRPYSETRGEALGICRSVADGTCPGWTPYEVACDLALQTGIISAAIVLNGRRRLTEKTQPKNLEDMPAPTPALTLEPLADCSRYDSLRSLRHLCPRDTVLKIENQVLQGLFLEITQGGSKCSPD
ncbi:MAG: hypothetical protein PHR16_00980 [Methylovulum sp.]|nr:hypothetical protein [Methylovulum sp.]